MMIKKIDTSFVGRPKGAKTSDFGSILRFKPLFCQSVPTNPTKFAEDRQTMLGYFTWLTKRPGGHQSQLTMAQSLYAYSAAEKVYLGVLQHRTKVQAKILTGKVYLGIKSKYPLGGRAVFRVYFWP